LKALLAKSVLKYIIPLKKGGYNMAGIPNWFVVVMGIATVFIGLICIILLCNILGVLCKALVKEDKAPEVKNAVASAPQNLPMPENKQEILAAVCAVIAEELGTEVEALKVVSFKRV
jgi:Na+-transporting methylmalonyl-CoA/oxaloacetate decarboxylase gamma subunit